MGYFTEKFKKLSLSTCTYQNFDIDTIASFPLLFEKYELGIQGLNVTIPYKQKIIPFLDELDTVAAAIGAVNTIKITPDGKKIGYNTDIYGFEQSLLPLLKKHHQKALILGTGGAAKAIAYVFKKLAIDFLFVSRTPKNKQTIAYDDLKEVLPSYRIIVNCTPIGTHPNIDAAPAIPYDSIGEAHILYDLIYNPKETLFLKKGASRGAVTKNGLEMLQLQAEKSWVLWNG